MTKRAQKAAEEGVSVFGYMNSAFSDVNVSSALNDAETAWWFYNNHPWVGSAVNLISGAIAADGYDIVNPTRTGDADKTDADPRVAALRTLFASINENQSLIDLVEEIAMDMDVPGKAFVHKLRLPNGKCVGLERIDSRTMAPVLSADGKQIAKFVQKIKVNGSFRTQNFPTDDIIFFKRPGGADLLGGQSLIQQLDLTLAVDFGSRKSNAARFRNGPRAGMVLVNKTKLSKDDAEKLDKLLKERAGAENSHKPMTLTGDFQPYFPKSEDDEEFTKGLDRARQEVCAVFHVPESKLMTTEGSLGGNGKEQDDQTFHEECVMPRCKRIYNTLTRELLVKEFKITDLVIAPKSKYALRVSAIKDAKELLNAGGSVNEARAMIGLQKSADTEADLDAPYVPSTVMKASADPQMALPLENGKPNEVGQKAASRFPY